MANAAIIMAICQSAMNCDESRPICVAFQMSAANGSSFALLRLHEVRYIQKKDQRLHKLVLELNQSACASGEIPSKLLDRYDKIVLGINAVDTAQLPTELQLISILRNAICEKFKLLNITLLSMPDLTLAQLKSSS